MTILVTGAAGFIGYHASAALLAAGEQVVGIDNLNAYYDPVLKQARLARLERHEGFRFERLDLADDAALMALVERERPDRILHLAAQAGVRYSLENPFAYARSNLLGHLAILEAARRLGDDLSHLVYASSSSVYGETARVPFAEADASETPASLYAATKRADELMSASYSSLYGIPATGLRFFTVYGPWGRPDMAYWLFADAMLSGRAIKVFNNGDMERDFTYIDDIVEPLCRILADAPARGRHAVYNIGGSSPVRLMDMIETLERALGLTAEKIMLPMQPGDVTRTFADTTKLEADYGYKATTRLEDGLPRFADWYRKWREGTV
ncbi:NAD-dependent epimerase/dehydratase family protein [Maricaulis virginensis]|uniref:UDP-N-acetylglucosamine 4-epimerase n=1 Tax=Maricaulis virginensis TaxID=144022 RepID=A0A9W6MP12_9PROT|nr:NAD-dependent epimerase/dehydratase family protein [Maricaulis virginensis]GLK52662.1 UDP-N-acetylglucosamine 4-epimerase [Maricaulis virginensis]